MCIILRVASDLARVPPKFFVKPSVLLPGHRELGAESWAIPDEQNNVWTQGLQTIVVCNHVPFYLNGPVPLLCQNGELPFCCRGELAKVKLKPRSGSKGVEARAAWLNGSAYDL